MTLTIRRAGAAEYGRYIKMLICGEPGSGKTRTASTAPNAIYASAEGGLMSIADRGIPYVDIEESDQLHKLKITLDRPREERTEFLGFDVETVVIDTIDEIQRILIRERLESVKEPSMRLQDWGWLGEQMQSIVRGFRNLDMHVVMLCHLKQSSDADSGKTWFDPGLQGAIAGQIPAYVDVAGVLQNKLVGGVEDGQAVQKRIRYLVTGPTAGYAWLKDRSGKLPAQLEIDMDGDFERIYDLIFSDLPDASPEPVVRKDPSDLEPDPEPAPEPVAAPVKKIAAKKVAAKKATAAKKAAGKKAEPKEKEGPEEESVPVGDEAPPGFIATPDCPKGQQFCEIDRDQADLSRIRFRKILCRECHQGMKSK